jgi:gliding motility-associated-like protein
VKRVIFIFTALFLKLACDAQTACPPYPESIKSGTLSYARLSNVGDATIGADNFRFFYKLTIECGIHPVLNDLFISDLGIGFSPGTSTEISWQLDSSKNKTGVIDPCIVFQASPCHTAYYYHADANLQYNKDGYLAATLNCCRPYDAANLEYQFNLNFDEPLASFCPMGGCGACVGTLYNGITSYIKVPQILTINSSPQITSNDTILAICKDRPFSYQVHATEPDGDSIAYHFSPPRSFTIFEYNKAYFPRAGLPFPAIDFKAGFSALQPAGANVFMDPSTGIIQGSISGIGTFVLTVSALEYRSGILLDSTMQDLFVQVFDCSLLPKPKASIPLMLGNCNSFTVQFPNNSTPLYTRFNWSNTTFQWDFGDGDTSHKVYPLHSYADTGTYHIRLIIFPGLYCADTAYAKTIVYPFLNASFSYNDSCSDQPVQFTNTSTSTGGTINYSDWIIKKDTIAIDSSNQYNTLYTFPKASQTYTVMLTVGTDKGCMTIDTQYVNIWQSPYPLASHDTILSRGTALQLQANDGNYNNGGLFSWSPPDGLNNTNISNPVLNSNIDNTYFVTIKNSHWCSLIDSIHVRYYTGPDIYAPSAFTPNGDGKNDIFKPIPVGISAFKYFRIFNRYGQMMFETSQPFKGWDGYYGGRLAPAGTYVWEAAGIDYDEKSISRKGTVILIR